MTVRGLANRRLQPLGHPSTDEWIDADTDAGYVRGVVESGLHRVNSSWSRRTLQRQRVAAVKIGPVRGLEAICPLRARTCPCRSHPSGVPDIGPTFGG
jgi:hypothetical protein